MVARRQRVELRIHAQRGFLCEFDVEIAQARRWLPVGVEPIESPPGWCRLLVNLLQLELGGLGIPSFWNLDVALLVEADDTDGPIDRAAFELRLGSDNSKYLDLLRQEGHPVYPSTDLEISETPRLEVADAEGPILLGPDDQAGPGQATRRWGQKLAHTQGKLLCRDYCFEGVLAAERPAAGAGPSLFSHPFFPFDPGSLGHCREIQWVRPGQATLDYFQRGPYTPQGRHS